MSNFLVIKNNKIFFDNTINSRNLIGYHTIKGNWYPYGYLIPLSFRGENMHEWLMGGVVNNHPECQYTAVITADRRLHVYSFGGGSGIMNIMSFQIEDDFVFFKSTESCIEESLGVLCNLPGELNKDELKSMYDTFPQATGDIQEWSLDFIIDELKRRYPDGCMKIRIPVNKENGSKPLK